MLGSFLLRGSVLFGVPRNELYHAPLTPKLLKSCVASPSCQVQRVALSAFSALVEEEYAGASMFPSHVRPAVIVLDFPLRQGSRTRILELRTAGVRR